MAVDFCLILSQAPFDSLEDDVKNFLREVLSDDTSITGAEDLADTLTPYMLDAGVMKDDAEVKSACSAFCSNMGFKPPPRQQTNTISACLRHDKIEAVMSAVPEDTDKASVHEYGNKEEVSSQPSSQSRGEQKPKAKTKAKVSRTSKKASPRSSKKASPRQSSASAQGQESGSRDLSEIATFGLQETEDGLDAFGSADITGKGHLLLIKQAEKYRDIVLPAVHISIVTKLCQTDLICGSPLRLMRGHKYGLIGRNGCGKTTLLRRLARRALPGLPPLRYGFVAQELTASEDSVLDVACAGDTEHRMLSLEKARLEDMLTNATGADDTAAIATEFVEVCDRLDNLTTFYGAEGLEGHARNVLFGLQFTPEMIKQPSKALSGGWKMRLALAQALLSRADVLLLDEPTNHLDLVGVMWLQQYLRTKISSDTILVIISHDREILDSVVTDIVEIRHKAIYQGPGNYSAWKMAQQEEEKGIQSRLDAVQRQEKKAAESLQRMKEEAQKKGKDADPNKQRQAKEKQIKLFGKVSASGESKTYGRIGLQGHSGSKFKLTYGTVMDIHEFATQRLAADGPDIKINFLEPEELQGVLLETENAYFKLDGCTILKNVNINVQPGCRIGVVGSNGSGKTTLLRLLLGEQWPDSRSTRHTKLKIAYVTQHHLQDLESHLNQACIDFFRHCLPAQDSGNAIEFSGTASDQTLIQYLARFGLGSQAKQMIGSLSGGQKARLALASQVWFRPHLLLLDEPTNHLDMDTLDALADALKAFAGATIIVSHNQHFLKTVCNELWIVSKGSVTSSGRGEELFNAKYKEYHRSALKKFRCVA